MKLFFKFVRNFNSSARSDENTTSEVKYFEIICTVLIVLSTYCTIT